MPAPQASDLKKKIRDKFTSFNIKIPQNWQTPSGDPAGKHYSDAFTASEKSTSPGSPALFQAATSNKYHTDSQKMHVAKIGAFIDDISTAICSAWSAWQMTTMAGIVITGPAAMGGALVPVPWTPIILAAGPVSTPMLAKYTGVVANVLGTAWLAFSSSIKLTGAKLWPTFLMWAAGPVAPPQPNAVPCKLSDSSSVFSLDTGLMAPALKGQMVSALGDPEAPFHKELFEAIATGFKEVFDDWKSKTEFKVIGGGPVPTYAPPYVPAGPVAGGVGFVPPGGII
jgi:hypothetical protein